MPSSLIIVALVGAWLLVLVPIVARRRQEVARTADSTLAARVVRSGGVHMTLEEGLVMSDSGEGDTAHNEYEADGEPHTDGDQLDDEDLEFDEEDLEFDEERLPEDIEAAQYEDEYPAEYAEDAAEEFGEDFEQDFDEDLDEDADFAEDEDYAEYEDPRASPHARPFRPGRGGFDPEAAAIAARAKYAFRQRVVVLMLLAAVASAIVAGFFMPVVWLAHGAIDLALVGYLSYLRRQVRIEEEIRQRRAARLGPPASRRVRPQAPPVREREVEQPRQEDMVPVATPVARRVPSPPVKPHPGTVVLDMDDEDPAFAELEHPGALPYRRAVGE